MISGDLIEKRHDVGQVFVPFSDSDRVTSRWVVIGGFRSPVALFFCLLSSAILSTCCKFGWR